MAAGDAAQPHPTQASPGTPCWEPPKRIPPGGGPVRVVELLATGSNGGAQEHVYNLVTRIDPAQFEVTIVSLSPGAAVRKLVRAGFPVCVIDTPDDDTAVEELTAFLAATGAQVVHNHMYRAEVVGTRAALALAAAGRPRPLVISTVHSSRVRSFEDRELVCALTPQMDHLIAVSTSIVQKIADEGRSGAPVSLIRNGVDLDRYSEQEACCTLREEYGMPPDSAIVGVVARLAPEKGHSTLLDAWPLVLARVPQAYLLVVGEGSRLEELQKQARDLGIADRVIFTGRRDDVPAVTAALDVAVLPSYREAQVLTILEAMALSRPVVASNVGGIPEMVEDGVTGLLVPPREPVPLADAIVRLLTDHPFADTLGRAGHDLAHERFCVEVMVRAICDLYDEARDRPVARATSA
jgi:glycosyltransferase involved in cell wall biosynthesis